MKTADLEGENNDVLYTKGVDDPIILRANWLVLDPDFLVINAVVHRRCRIQPNCHGDGPGNASRFLPTVLSRGNVTRPVSATSVFRTISRMKVGDERLRLVRNVFSF